jgi:hypothetical protein
MRRRFHRQSIRLDDFFRARAFSGTGKSIAPGPGDYKGTDLTHIAARSFGRKCARERRRYYKQGEAHGFYKDCKQSNLGSGKLVGKMRKEEPRQDERGGKDREGWPRRPSMRDKEERAERRYRTEPDTT